MALVAILLVAAACFDACCCAVQALVACKFVGVDGDTDFVAAAAAAAIVADIFVVFGLVSSLVAADVDKKLYFVDDANAVVQATAKGTIAVDGATANAFGFVVSTSMSAAFMLFICLSRASFSLPCNTLSL